MKILTGVLIMTFNLNAAINLPEYKNVKFTPPQAEKIVLDNGFSVYIKEDHTLPTVRATLYIKTGKVYDPTDKRGLGELFFATLKEGGSKKYSPEEIDKTLEYLGANITSNINNEDGSVSMFSLKKDFSRVFDIFSDIILEPAFDTKKFELKKQEMIELIKRRNDRPSEEAFREALRKFYGKNHPYGWRKEIETVNKIERDDLIKYHENYFKPNNMVMAIAGDFKKQEVINKIKEVFGKLKKQEVNFPQIPDVKTPEKRKIYIINKPVRQTFIVMLMKGIKRHNPEEFPLSVLSEYMGGGIQSKLGQEIRSKRGLAYSVYSYFAKRYKEGFIAVYLGTKPSSVYQAINQVITELENVKKGNMDKSDFEMAKSQLINSFVFRFSNIFDIVNERASYNIYGYPENYLDTYTDNIDKVKLDDVINTAKKYYNTDRILIFVVGDSSKFDRDLKDLGEVEILQED